MTLSKMAQDHEEVRYWAEARGALPAEASSTHRKDEPGVLRHAKGRKSQSLNKQHEQIQCP